MQLAAKTYLLDMPVARPLMSLIKIRRNLYGYLTAGSFGCDLSYEAQKRYADTDAHHFFALRALPAHAAIAIFSDTTLKDNLSPKLPKSF